MDYYSQTVFEIQSDLLGAQSALCGGGRYDYLVEELGGEPTPAIGFAAGIERLILAIENNNRITKKNPDIYIISMDESSHKYSFVVENRLRRNKKLKIISDKLRRTMKSQMKDANRLMAKNVIIIGEEEMNSGQLTLKDMNTGDQQKLTLDNIVDHFK